MASLLDRPRLVTEGIEHVLFFEYWGWSCGGNKNFNGFNAGARPEDGVPDMTVISEIDEFGINTNLKTRYNHNKIYVSPAQPLLP